MLILANEFTVQGGVKFSRRVCTIQIHIVIILENKTD